MAHQSLYRRYRPQRFGEIRGQAHVRQALQNAVREGRWGHAYLFSGPRGTGKTTTARVLAKALNCQDLGPDGEPCGGCESCLAIEAGRSFDLHELDAASNRGIEAIREHVIDRVNLGSPGRTKVYILDEVHMLSAPAANALLKTLEEPPDHVVFVLATTEPNKVMPTIRSRTQHFEFNLLAGEELAEHVRWVVGDAGLEVGEDGIEYALRAGGGSARDTLSALDLVAAAGGVPAGTDIGPRLAEAVAAGDAAATVAAVQRALEAGREPRAIGEETLAHLRDAFLAAMGAPLAHLSDAQAELARATARALPPAALTRALEALGSAIVDMRQAPDPRIPLEVCLLRLARRTGDDVAAVLHRIEALEAEVAALRAAASVGAPPAAPGGPGRTRAPFVPDPPRVEPAAPTRATPHPAPGAARTPPSAGPGSAGAVAAAPTPPRRGRPGDAARRSLAEPPSPRPPDAGPSPPGEVAPPPPSRPAGQPGAAAVDAPPLTLDAVRSAWASTVLDQLPNKARARYRPGRVVSFEGDTVLFALPNPIHRDRCAELRPDVESALGAALGRPVHLRLEVDTTPGPPPGPGGSPQAIDLTDPAGPPDDDIGDVSQLADAGDVATSGLERLTRAFPGSEVITPDETNGGRR
jgi:DNA polymerase-3 subunit gamma/tau